MAAGSCREDGVLRALRRVKGRGMRRKEGIFQLEGAHKEAAEGWASDSVRMWGAGSREGD